MYVSCDTSQSLAPSVLPTACCCRLLLNLPSCRRDIRLVSNNVTHVAASQREVEYLAYWQVMFSSTDPALKEEAAWLQRGPGITVWEVRRLARACCRKCTTHSAALLSC